MTATVSGPAGLFASKERPVSAQQNKPVRMPGTPANVSEIFLGGEDAARMMTGKNNQQQGRIIKVSQAKSGLNPRLGNYPKFGKSSAV